MRWIVMSIPFWVLFVGIAAWWQVSYADEDMKRGLLAALAVVGTVLWMIGAWGYDW